MSVINYLFNTEKILTHLIHCFKKIALSLTRIKLNMDLMSFFVPFDSSRGFNLSSDDSC